jgi:hypothetical protein
MPFSNTNQQAKAEAADAAMEGKRRVPLVPCIGGGTCGTQSAGGTRCGTESGTESIKSLCFNVLRLAKAERRAEQDAEQAGKERNKTPEKQEARGTENRGEGVARICENDLRSRLGSDWREWISGCDDYGAGCLKCEWAEWRVKFFCNKHPRFRVEGAIQ